MKKLFAPYEIAKQLKEKGFDEPCIAHHVLEQPNNNYVFQMGMYFYREVKPNYILAPLYQQVCDWFETEHKILISIEREPFGKWIAHVVNNYEKTHQAMGNLTYYSNRIILNNDLEGFNNKYEALNTAIEKSLTLLK